MTGKNIPCALFMLTDICDLKPELQCRWQAAVRWKAGFPDLVEVSGPAGPFLNRQSFSVTLVKTEHREKVSLTVKHCDRIFLQIPSDVQWTVAFHVGRSNLCF